MSTTPPIDTSDADDAAESKPLPIRNVEHFVPLSETPGPEIDPTTGEPKNLEMPRAYRSESFKYPLEIKSYYEEKSNINRWLLRKRRLDWPRLFTDGRRRLIKYGLVAWFGLMWMANQGDTPAAVPANTPGPREDQIGTEETCNKPESQVPVFVNSSLSHAADANFAGMLTNFMCYSDAASDYSVSSVTDVENLVQKWAKEENDFNSDPGWKKRREQMFNEKVQDQTPRGTEPTAFNDLFKNDMLVEGCLVRQVDSMGPSWLGLSDGTPAYEVLVRRMWRRTTAIDAELVTVDGLSDQFSSCESDGQTTADTPYGWEEVSIEKNQTIVVSFPGQGLVFEDVGTPFKEFTANRNPSLPYFGPIDGSRQREFLFSLNTRNGPRGYNYQGLSSEASPINLAEGLAGMDFNKGIFTSYGSLQVNELTPTIEAFEAAMGCDTGLSVDGIYPKGMEACQ